MRPSCIHLVWFVVCSRARSVHSLGGGEFGARLIYLVLPVAFLTVLLSLFPQPCYSATVQRAVINATFAYCLTVHFSSAATMSVVFMENSSELAELSSFFRPRGNALSKLCQQVCGRIGPSAPSSAPVPLALALQRQYAISASCIHTGLWGWAQDHCCKAR